MSKCWLFGSAHSALRQESVTVTLTPIDQHAGWPVHLTCYMICMHALVRSTLVYVINYTRQLV
jgi:hypothetical protein